MARDTFDGISPDTARELNAKLASLEQRLRELERKPGRAGIITRDTAVRSGDLLNIEAPAAGLTVILPESTQKLRNARVTLAFRNTNPVRIVCAQGTVNREAFVINTSIGTFEAVCDGLGGWSVETGLSSTGLPTTATWADVLANGNTSGAKNPSINSGQRIIFAGTGASPAQGDIDAAGDLTLDSVGDMHLHPHGALHLGHTGITDLVHIEADAEVDIVAGADILEQAVTSIAVQAGTSWALSTGAVLRLTVESDGSWNIGGSNGTDGQYCRSFGSGAPPQWATIDAGELADIPDQTVLGNDTGAAAPPEPITVHQELDWLGGSSTEEWIFDGVDDRIEMGDVLDKERTDAFSLSAWFKTATANGFVVGKFETSPTTRGYAIQLAAGRIRFVLSSTNTVSVLAIETNSTFNNDALHRVVVTYNGNSLASGVVIYIDDAAQATTTVFNNLTTTTLNAASYTIGIAGGLLGPIKHDAIWNRVLTAPEVVEVGGGGTPPDLLATSCASALQGWWRIDDGDAVGAGGINDYGGANDGTALGGLAPSTISNFVGSIPVRGTSQWELITAGGLQTVLMGQGVNVKPRFLPLPYPLQGEPGADGQDGLDGQPGIQGLQGIQGIQGPPGQDGLDGADGLPGQQGQTGETGATGADGAAGVAGAAGAPGADGQDGADGIGSSTPDLAVFVGGALVGRRQELDLVQGTNVTLTPSVVGGRPTVTVAASGGGGGSGAIAVAVAVNLGSTPRYSGSFDVTGLSGLTLNDPVLVTTGVNTADPTESEEQIAASGIAISTSSFRVYWESLNGPVYGTRTFYYLTATSVTVAVGSVIVEDGNVSTVNPATILNFDASIEATDAGGGQADIAYIGTTSELVLTAPSGNQGTVDISTVRCGGTVRATGTGIFSIEGFTSPPNDGFWFVFTIPEGALCTLYNEDTTATAANRMRTPHARDATAFGQQALLLYNNARWRVVTSGVLDPGAYATAQTSVTNSTTLITWASLSIPANTMTVGASWELYGALNWARAIGAPATASNLTVRGRIAGTAVHSITRATQTAAGVAGTVVLKGRLTCYAVGASGELNMSVDMVDSITASILMSMSAGTVVVDTTAAVVVDMDSQFSAAVANLSQTLQAGVIRRDA